MYGFEDFRIEPDERRLWRGEAAVTLTPKAFDLLLFLVEHEGRLLRKNDLLSAVWPDSAVEENNLTVAVSALRKALGESEKRRFIETVPKKGYRFVAQVTDLRYQEAPLSEDGVASAVEAKNGAPRAEEEQEIAPGELAQPQEDAPKAVPRRYGTFAIASLFAALTALGYSGYYGRRIAAPQPANVRFLAILPFRNLRGDAQDEFLALSLADAVITKLG